jgi:hypothetical protein
MFNKINKSDLFGLFCLAWAGIVFYFPPQWVSPADRMSIVWALGGAGLSLLNSIFFNARSK